MSINYIPSTSSTVTQAQLTTTTNACVKKSVLTTTGGANGVPQYDGSGNLTTSGKVTTGAAGVVCNGALAMAANQAISQSGNKATIGMNGIPSTAYFDTTSNIFTVGGTSNSRSVICASRSLAATGYYGIDGSNNTFVGADNGSVLFRTGMLFNATDITTSGTIQMQISPSLITTNLPLSANGSTQIRTGYANPGTGGNAAVSVNGNFGASVTNNEHLLQNNWSGQNVCAVQNLNTTNAFSVIRYLKSTGDERCALGYGNPDAAQTANPFQDAVFFESSHLVNADGTFTYGAPQPMRFVLSGTINSTNFFHRRLELSPDGTFNYYNIAPTSIANQVKTFSIASGATANLVGIGDGSGISGGAGAANPINTLDVFGNATIGKSTTASSFRAADSTAALTTYSPNAGGISLRLIRDGIGKLDITYNTTPKRMDFIDTDNSSVVPLSIALDGSAAITTGSGGLITTGNITQTGAKSVSTGTGGITCNGVMSCSGIATHTANIVQTGSTSISSGSAGMINQGRLALTNASVPTVFSTSTGAGTLGSPTVTVTGNDTVGQITVFTGTNPSLAAIVCTITYNTAYATTPIVILTPGTAIQSNVNAVVATTSTTVMTLKCMPGVSLTASSNYIWNYLVIAQS